jgi:hypothetical protein
MLAYRILRYGTVLEGYWDYFVSLITLVGGIFASCLVN